MTVSEVDPKTTTTDDPQALATRLTALESRLDQLEASQPDDKVAIVVFSGDLDKVLASFVIATGAAALGQERLYRYDDPLGALSLNVMEDGDECEWHFDQADFVVSIALQDAEAGGDFLYVPLIRSAGEENYEGVAEALAGERQATRIPMKPGTLLLFEGRNSIHCVSPCRGATPRLVALLAYDTQPGTCASELLQKSRYGRILRPASEGAHAR